jgi:serine/threonine protein kinase
MASRFEAAWNDSDTVDMTAFLPPPDDPLRSVALHELIKTDMAARWSRGQIIGIEAYLEKFPELGTAAELSPALIYEEYRVRHVHGDKPPVNGYQRRFSHQFAELKRLIDQHPLPDVSATPSSTPATPQPVEARQTLHIGGEYKMIRLLGCGGFAEVWQAETPAGFPVAIKRVLRPLDHAEAQVELRALGEIKQLRHTYLLQTRDYGLLDNRLYIVMDLAECTLADRAQQCKAAGLQGIPLDELLRYIHEAAEAIDYMHSKKVHHRDIKPKNILLDGGHAKVADFGLARMVESQRLTNTGSGTAPYMAPEVWRRQISPFSDQYSLGVSYAELRLGRLPFAGTDMYSLMMDHIEGRPNLENLPDAEQQVLRKVMAKDPAERYPNCLAFVHALEMAVEPVLVASAPIGKSRRLSGVSKRQPVQVSDDVGTIVRTDTPNEPPPTKVDSDLTAPKPGGGWKDTQQAKPSGLHWKYVIAGFALVTVVIATWWFRKSTGTFQVGTPSSVTVKAGESTTLQVPIERSGFDGLIQMSATPGAGGISISGICQARAESAELTIRADKDADLGEQVLEVHADAEGMTPREFKVTVTVQPAYWQTYWHVSDDARVLKDSQNRRHYSKIEIDRDGLSVPFVLVPQEVAKGGDDLSTFYIMQDKVSNEIYSKFAAAHKEKAGETWKNGGRKAEGNETIDIKNTDGRLPALRMTVREAYEFAVWLGGNLPTMRQWDKASGYDKREAPGPFHLPKDRANGPKGPMWKVGEIAINRAKEGPMHVGEAKYDEGPYHCRDMAGNGLEFTRNLAGTRERLVPIAAKPQEDDFVILRGMRYSETVPWLFASVDDRDAWKLWPYTGVDPEIGFRVVLKLD